MIIGVLILALGAFFLLRKRKQSALVKPDDGIKELHATGLAELPSKEGGQEKAHLLGQQQDGSGQPMPELPQGQQLHPQPALNHLNAGNNISGQPELDAPTTGTITNFAELSNDPYRDAAELDGTKPRSELPGGGASNAH